MNFNFIRRKKYSNNIITYLKKEISINRNTYQLVGLINTPEYNHFTGTLVNYNNNLNRLKQNFDYYYDVMSLDNEISMINNLDELLSENIPYGMLYLLKN